MHPVGRMYIPLVYYNIMRLDYLYTRSTIYTDKFVEGGQQYSKSYTDEQ